MSEQSALEKALLSDIRSSILTEYQGLKLENKTNYKTSKYVNNLTILLSKHLRKTNTIVTLQIKEAISQSSNPIELLKNLNLN
jgi:hypothetical protein